MTETTLAPPIHWSAIEPGAKADGTSDPRSKDQLATHFAAMCLAHMKGYADAFHLPSWQTREGVRSACAQHLWPAIAAFSAAAALKGWDAQQIDGTVEDGASVDEWCWQWLDEAGLTQAVIDRLAWDVNAPDVLMHVEDPTA